MTAQIKQNLFLIARTMKLYSEVGVAVPIDYMAGKLGCSEQDVIDTWKWFVDNGHDRREGVCFEFTNDYTGLIKKLSLEVWIQKFEIEQQLMNEHSKRMRI